MTSPSSLALWLGIKEVAGDIGLPSSLSRCSDNLSRFFSRIFWPRRGEGEDKRLSKYLPQSDTTPDRRSIVFVSRSLCPLAAAL